MGEKNRRAAAGLPHPEGNAKAARLLREAKQFLQERRFKDAKLGFERVLQLEPARVDALKGLASVALEIGMIRAAASILAKALELEPDDPRTRRRYAQVLESLGAIEASIQQWQELCRLEPQVAEHWESLGLGLQYLGDTAEAAQAYDRALACKPGLGVRAKTATLISPIIASSAAMRAERQRMECVLDDMLGSPVTEPVLEDPMASALWTNFYLAYHGMSDLTLQVKTAQLYRRIVPSLSFVAEHCIKKSGCVDGKIKIGLISQFFHNHSIGRTSRGLFAGLSKDRFEVSAIFIAPTVDDEYSSFIRQHADRSITVPQDLTAARALIAAQRLDVLFYQDIGMEPFGYFLAYSRLAPVQCVSFGHPDTTGISTIDYFISNDLYEKPEASSHYSENLYLLNDLGTLAYYYRPVLPKKPKTRADFGLSDEDRIYLCPQNLFKVHPDMDELLGGILRRDPRGKLLMVSGKIGHWTELLQRRWNDCMPDVASQIVFLPRMASADYLTLIALADVMLDTVHFNGMNTSLEAFSVGTPVVTLPGEFQRGRHTQAMYRKMGLTECIATSPQSYIDIAVTVANNSALRAGLAERILEHCPCLYEDPRVIQEFERCFSDLVQFQTSKLPA
ncbi:MAG: tetratricopeptide repeat protein [Rhodoferax sp.]